MTGGWLPEPSNQQQEIQMRSAQITSLKRIVQITPLIQITWFTHVKHAQRACTWIVWGPEKHDGEISTFALVTLWRPF